MEGSRGPGAGRAQETARRDVRQWRIEATALIHEILAVAEVIGRARTGAGERIVHRDAQWRLLCAIERARGCPSVSDLARMLKISRQTAQRLVHKAAELGQVTLLTNVTDRRILQVELQPLVRRRLQSARELNAVWVIGLLNGLDMREMRRLSHVLFVIRQRLIRDERAVEAQRRRRRPCAKARAAAHSSSSFENGPAA